MATFRTTPMSLVAVFLLDEEADAPHSTFA